MPPPPDARPTAPTLGEFLIGNQVDHPTAEGELTRVLNAIRLAAKVVNHNVNQAGLVDITGAADHVNVQGEQQQKLDVFADNAFTNTLIHRDLVCGIVSEEREDVLVVAGRDGAHRQRYVVLMDPLDGSSNVDVAAPVGTVFSVFHRVTPRGTPVTAEDFLQPGTLQVAAGYVLYGTSTIMVFTTGRGVNGFTLNPALGTYYLSHPDMRFPDRGAIYSVNEGKYARFPRGVKDYIKYCQREEGDRPYASRYIGALAADFHRSLVKGGVYLYPETSDSPHGKLRLLYECNPIAMLAEQAGGAASDGARRILELKPTELHERVPFFCGNAEMVADIERFMAAAG